MMPTNLYSHLMAPSSMPYVLNGNPMSISTLAPTMPTTTSFATKTRPISVNPVSDQYSTLKDQNQALQKKLHNKTLENGKLEKQITKLKTDLTNIRQLLENVKVSVGNGVPVEAINEFIQKTLANIQTSQIQVKKTYPKKKSNKETPNCQCCTVADKPYVCDWENCGKRFRQKVHLDAHRNIHTGRRFHCDWPGCAKSFCRKFNLVEHAKMHSSNNPNMCTYPNCGKTFSSKYVLQRHQNAQHILRL